MDETGRIFLVPQVVCHIQDVFIVGIGIPIGIIGGINNPDGCPQVEILAKGECVLIPGG